MWTRWCALSATSAPTAWTSITRPASRLRALTSGRIQCSSDALSVQVVEAIRAALPPPFAVAAAGWSVGAYGEGNFVSARPRSPWTGSMLAMLRSPAGQSLDLVTIMSYDAGPSYRPDEALRAYRAYYKGPLALGIQVQPGTSGGPRFTLDYTVRMLARWRATRRRAPCSTGSASRRPAPGAGQSGLSGAVHRNLRRTAPRRLLRVGALEPDPSTLKRWRFHLVGSRSRQRRVQATGRPSGCRATTLQKAPGRLASGSSAPSSASRKKR